MSSVRPLSRSRAFRLVLPFCAATAGCTLLVEHRATQCARDDECAAFGNARCSSGVCVQRGATSGEDAGGVGVDGGDVISDAGNAGADTGNVSADAGHPGADGPPIAGDASNSSPCHAPAKPRVEVAGDITANFTLTCDKDYVLSSTVFVKPGVTLTIQRGTTVLGQNNKAQPSVLVVQPGAKIVAEGTASEPIVFTSALAATERKPGDWGGVVILGNAPINVRDNSGRPVRGQIEGITVGGEYGGNDEDDNSGILKYVRIEYAGIAIAPNNEVNGLTFGGVGRATVVDYVQVRQSADDCFEFFGGTVNAKHLICQYNGDDGFDWDNGYRGKLQFLVLQQDPAIADETNGFEGDNNALGADDSPVSEPTIYNATLCGKNVEVAAQQYGLLVRRSSKAHIFNAIVTGFEAGLDIRDARTDVEVKNSIFYGNVVKNLAYEEDGSNADNQKDDDNGLDEIAWLMRPEQRNVVSDPGLDCFNPVSPRFQPKASLTANATAPPSDGFFEASAFYVGAFRDASDAWASGNWVVFSDR
jgi:hypothetical protein